MTEDWDKIAALLKELDEYDSPIWKVYVLVNNKKKEIYFGVTKKQIPERGAEHAKALSISRTGRVAAITKQPDGSDLTCP